MPISVNMLGLRNWMDAMARWKNGKPPQSTTGEASRNSIQATMWEPDACSPDVAMGNDISTMATSSSGTPKNRLTRSLRVM